jgi:hypothetical protein
MLTELDGTSRRAADVRFRITATIDRPLHSADILPIDPAIHKQTWTAAGSSASDTMHWVSAI